MERVLIDKTNIFPILSRNSWSLVELDGWEFKYPEVWQYVVWQIDTDISKIQDEASSNRKFSKIVPNLREVFDHRHCVTSQKTRDFRDACVRRSGPATRRFVIVHTTARHWFLTTKHFITCRSSPFTCCGTCCCEATCWPAAGHGVSSPVCVIFSLEQTFLVVSPLPLAPPPWNSTTSLNMTLLGLLCWLLFPVGLSRFWLPP